MTPGAETRRRFDVGAYLPAIAVGVVATLFGLSLMLGGAGQGRMTFDTTMSVLPTGYGALHEFLTAQGCAAGRWTKPFMDLDRGGARRQTVAPNLDSTAAAGILWIVAPQAWSWSAADFAALERWIERGHTVVVALANERQPLDFTALMRDTPRASEPRASPSPSLARPASNAEDGDENHAAFPNWEFTKRFALALEPVEIPRSGKVRQSLAARTIAPPRAKRLVGFGGAALEDAEILLAVEDVPYVISFKRGYGRIVVVASSLPFETRNLSKGDNAVLAYYLASRFGPAVFDETSHGFTHRASPFSFLWQTRARYPAAALALFSLLFLWGALPRRRPAITAAAGRRRTTGEFIAALTVLLTRTRDIQTLWDRYRRGARQALPALLGLPSQASEGLVGRQLDRRVRAAGARPETAAALLDPGSTGRRPRTLGELVESAARIDALLRRLRASPAAESRVRREIVP